MYKFKYQFLRNPHNYHLSIISLFYLIFKFYFDEAEPCCLAEVAPSLQTDTSLQTKQRYKTQHAMGTLPKGFHLEQPLMPHRLIVIYQNVFNYTTLKKHLLSLSLKVKHFLGAFTFPNWNQSCLYS